MHNNLVDYILFNFHLYFTSVAYKNTIYQNFQNEISEKIIHLYEGDRPLKKIINEPGSVLEEMLEGFTKANQELVKRIPETSVIVSLTNTDQVGLVSGGGSGHEPAHAGFVGDGMLQAAVCGQIFTSPTPDQILEGIKAADNGKGVLLIVKNYSGDIMNFEMAKDIAELEGIEVELVVVDDDIAVEDSTYTQGKRGVAGTILVHKILGAAARQGEILTELVALANELIPTINTIGVALTGATVPEVGKPGFLLAEDELEFGVGIHGEPGYSKRKMLTSDEIAEEMLLRLNDVAPFSKGQKYAVLVNGLGSTPLMEQYIFFNDVAKKLAEKEVRIVFSKVGDFMTAIDMAGVSLTLLEIKSEHWLDCLNQPVQTAAW